MQYDSRMYSFSIKIIGQRITRLDIKQARVQSVCLVSQVLTLGQTANLKQKLGSCIYSDPSKKYVKQFLKA